MAIRGVIDSVTPEVITGWCFDTESTEPAQVELRVDSVFLMSVRADLPRRDLVALAGTPNVGFRLPIASNLRRVLPHNGIIEVTSSGKPLFLPPQPPRSRWLRLWLRLLPWRLSMHRQPKLLVDNPACSSIDTLVEMLDSGYVITSKYGALFRPVGQRDGINEALDSMEKASEIFRRVTGKELFICYGTLLGHVRHKGFIEHDDDIDLCFLANSDSWQSAFAEFQEVVDGLRAHGAKIWVDSGIQFHWQRKGIALDIFMGWMEGDTLNMYYSIGQLPRERICPLRQEMFNGRAVLVPREPEAMLELIYGPTWHIPDPQFQFQETPEIRRKMKLYREAGSALLARDQKQHWSQFYAQAPRNETPSSFAVSVAEKLKEESWIIELGCGDGRDSFFFAEQGHRVLGMDAEAGVVERNRVATHDKVVDGACTFVEADLSSQDALRQAMQGHFPRRVSGDSTIVYGRFFLHAVEEEVERCVLDALRDLPKGARCFFEFRTLKDAQTPKKFKGHYRRFIDLDQFIGRATAGGAMECVYRVEGKGMAKYGDEDPVVGRVHLRRR